MSLRTCYRIFEQYACRNPDLLRAGLGKLSFLASILAVEESPSLRKEFFKEIGSWIRKNPISALLFAGMIACLFIPGALPAAVICLIVNIFFVHKD